VTGGDDAPNLLGRARQHDHAGQDGVLEQPVGLVGAALVAVHEHVLVAGDRAEVVDQVHARIVPGPRTAGIEGVTRPLGVPFEGGRVAQSTL
jgi:hypothetical protein